MSQTPRFELLAQIDKTKGLHGQLVAHEMNGLSVLHTGLKVWIVPPPLEGVRHTHITELKPHKQGVLLSLSGIRNKSEASKLIGRYLLAPSNQALPSITHKDACSEELSEVLFSDTAYGELGKLRELKSGPAYEIWVVEGPYGQLEIPAVTEYIVEENSKNIVLTLPRGFIEATRSAQAVSYSSKEGE